MARWTPALLLILLTGCATTPIDPAFPATTSRANTVIQTMRDTPKPLARPLVVVGGFLDPGFLPLEMTCFFHGVLRDATIIPVSVGFCGNFDDCRKAVIDAVEQACPSSDPHWTTEVDVVGASLGGLVARYAAAESLDPRRPRRLKIARLFTISSPHAGAKLAGLAPMPDLNRDLRPSSAFLEYLATQDRSAHYQLMPYVHLGDEVVGDRLAAPPGRNVYWLANDSLLLPHGAAMVDPRILADIARRLRDEAPLTCSTPVPIP